VLLAYGCIESIPLIEEPEEETPQVVCKNVTEKVPAEFEECQDVAYTEQVCDRRELNYTISLAPIVHFCQIDGDCGGQPLSTCTGCVKAMTRCTMTIHNTEEKKSGSWSVGANFTVTGSVFSREPVTKTIEPGEGAAFDFQHFYSPGTPINSASCELFIKDKALIDECHEETRSKVECSNVTKMVSIQKEVCE
jgi:hypothetical protein